MYFKDTWWITAVYFKDKSPCILGTPRGFRDVLRGFRDVLRGFRDAHVPSALVGVGLSGGPRYTDIQILMAKKKKQRNPRMWITAVDFRDAEGLWPPEATA